MDGYITSSNRTSVLVYIPIGSVRKAIAEFRAAIAAELQAATAVTITRPH